MVELIATGRCEIGRLAAVTFTRKAAAELRGRFTAQLEREARASSGERAARLAAALGHAERCFIGTIHSFCARLLRERPIEAGVDRGLRGDRRGRRRDPAGPRLGGVRRGTLRRRRPARRAARRHRHPPRAAQGVLPDVRRRIPTSRSGRRRRSGSATSCRRARRSSATCRASAPWCRRFPEERGTDRLMARYESIERLARHRDLDPPGPPAGGARGVRPPARRRLRSAGPAGRKAASRPRSRPGRSSATRSPARSSPAGSRCATPP